jgi:hypothetical protein
MSMGQHSAILSPEEYDNLCQEYMNAVYHGVSGFISYEPGEKEAGEKKKVYLTYGEMLYPSVSKIINYLGDINENDVFYDLGSGIGKVGLQFFLRSPVKKARGIEYSATRNKYAEQVYAQVQKEFPELVAGRILDCINGNFLEQDISDATIIYACSTCYSEELLADIGKMIDAQCPNIRYIATNKHIPNKLPFDRALEVECSWDKTKWQIYGKPQGVLLSDLIDPALKIPE